MMRHGQEMVESIQSVRVFTDGTDRVYAADAGHCRPLSSVCFAPSINEEKVLAPTGTRNSRIRVKSNSFTGRLMIDSNIITYCENHFSKN
jgi:hypothetical protein